MSFNPDLSKQAKEIIFSKKQSNIQLPVLTFNSILSPTSSYKHLGMILDSKLNFRNHLSGKINKANKGIGTIRRLYNFLPRASLINIYKLDLIRPHLDYGDIIYDNSSNVTFSQMIESVQYNAALAITGAIRGSSRDKLYHELGLESLHDRRW